MAEELTQSPAPIPNFTLIISAWGGIITGTAGLIMALDYGRMTGAAYLAAAALAFGLVTIAMRRR